MPAHPSPDHSRPAEPRSLLSRLILPAALLLVALLLLLTWNHLTGQPGQTPQKQEEPAAVFQGLSNHPEQSTVPVSLQCGACHEKIFREWADSDHAWAHRNLTPRLDAEPFHGLPLKAHGTTLNFATDEKGDRVIKDQTTGQTWTMDMAIGRVPLVQYLTRGRDGGYHTTSAAWDTQKREWFDMFGADSRKPGEWGHWTGRGMIWNTQCAWCHMTDFRKNYDTATHTYHSHWKEPGVTCLQCHGPVLEKRDPKTNCMIDTEKKLSLKQQNDNCATCHARREELDNEFKLGDKFEDHFILALPTQPGLYWPNGMQRDEVYTETGLKLSRMGKAGIQCLDCHNAHTLKLKKSVEDNALCLQCHGTGERNAPIINPVEHSHHKPDSTGNRCVECHMPESPYMARDPRRDHSFSSPDPQLSIELGIPNSCIMCHKDKSNEWAAKYVKEWYGDLPLTSHRDRTRAVQKALEGAEDIAPALLAALDKEQNSYWRATLLELLSTWAHLPEVFDRGVKAAQADNPLERIAAANILSQRKAKEMLPLLSDPVRTVRVQAAWGLRDILPAGHPAMKELEASALHQGDQPSGAMKLAQIYAARAALAKSPEEAEPWHKKAEEWFRKALEWDPGSPIVYRDFAVYLAARGRTAESLQHLQKASKLEPKNPHLHYLVALAQAETGETGGAIDSLTTALKLNPRYAPALYNRALLKNSIEQPEAAIQDLAAADKAEPETPRYAYTQALLLCQTGNTAQARRLLLDLQKRFPNLPEISELLQQIGE